MGKQTRQGGNDSDLKKSIFNRASRARYVKSRVVVSCKYGTAKASIEKSGGVGFFIQ